ncbi:MAG: DNA alkylation repair protein [Myxococcota bacterium]|jgi:hypothetical protein|nr:DNA alkylation repair protein [Myxococcota bacterium]
MHEISRRLDMLAKDPVALRRMKQIQPLKGLRGVTLGEVAQVAAEAYRHKPLVLPDDFDVLHDLFCTAHEDGLVAIALASAAAVDEPEDGLELGLRWLDMVDDLETADALGWLLIGPALQAMASEDELAAMVKDERSMVRRTAVMGCLSALPVRVEGPAAAALRERAGERHIQMVDAPNSELLAKVMLRAVRDRDPHVLRAVGRVLRGWGESDAHAVTQFIETCPGGMPKRLREQAEKGARKGRRR